jgi:hypothetical protein
VTDKAKRNDDGALFLAIFIVAGAAMVLSGCIDSNQARRDCRRSTVKAVESAVKEASAHHLKECKTAIRKVSDACRPLSCDCEPCKPKVKFVAADPCDDPPPCRWDDIERGKLSKWRICAVMISEAHDRWTKDNCDPMPCHCE